MKVLRLLDNGSPVSYTLDGKAGARDRLADTSADNSDLPARTLAN